MPPKAKAKSKKAPPINFASLSSALSSAPSLDAQQWLTEGDGQESQGERYISGDKAQRHYHNAIIAYRASFRLAPSFDAAYNSARVGYLLATDHLDETQAWKVLQESIGEYRTALETEKASGEATLVSSEIDGLFNLAEALVAQADMIDEGVVPTLGDAESSRAAEEARSLFVEVERLQRAEMARNEAVQATAPSSDAGEGDTMDTEETSNDDGDRQLVEAVEIRPVTLYQILNTVLEILSIETSLLSSPSPTVSSFDLANSATSTLERAQALRAVMPPIQSDAEQDLELSLAQLSLQAALPSSNSDPSLIAEAFKTLLSHPSNSKNVSLLSEYGDYLLSILDSPPSSSTSFDPVAIIQEALSAFLEAHSLLGNRLSPPKGLKAFQLPALVMTNLSSQAYLHLVLFHHFESIDSARASKAYEEAKRLVMEAETVGGKESVGERWKVTTARRAASYLKMRIWTRSTDLSQMGKLVPVHDVERLKGYVEECQDDAAWRMAGEGVEESWWRTGLAKIG